MAVLWSLPFALPLPLPLPVLHPCLCRDTWQQKEAEEKARVLANAERDMLLKKKSESIRKFEEERRWSKLTPQQRLQELMGRIETEEGCYCMQLYPILSLPCGRCQCGPVTCLYGGGGDSCAGTLSLLRKVAKFPCDILGVDPCRGPCAYGFRMCLCFHEGFPM